ncbi:MAG: hypothetical protein COB22_02330 [Cycloclasticus sp.]|nr:MAG: hypothetical protein COB22_02330 [Cycloclasticus sp.]
MTIYVFYNNDPLASDQGGGAEHLRGIYRALNRTDKSFKLVSSKMQDKYDSKDVEYISNGANIMLFFMAMFVWFFKNKSSLTESDVFHFHRNYTVWPKFLVIGKRGKTIITYHNHTGKILEDWFGGWVASVVRNIMLRFERSAVSLVDRVIFVSDGVRQQLKREVIRSNYNKTVVIPAAFDSSAFEGCSTAEAELANRIVVIGRLASIKNFNLAIETLEFLCAEGHQYYLTIVGDGELRDELEKKVGASKFKENIIMYGLAEHSEIREIIAKHGIVMVSSKFEASPTIVKEGIASMRPIVTTDVGDVDLWIKEGVNGYICNHTAESLGSAIKQASNLILEGGYKQSVDLNEFSELTIMNKLIEQYTF